MPENQLAPDGAVPPPSDPLAVPGLTEKEMAERLAAAEEEMRKVEMSEEPVITDDFNAALGFEPETWFINTGRRDARTDQPIKLRVVVRDPGTTDPALGYIYATNKEEAARKLLSAIVVSPKEMLTAENWQKLRSAPRLMLVWRGMAMCGIDGDFFENLRAMASEKERRMAASFATKSPSPTGSTRAKSGPGNSETSPMPSSSLAHERIASVGASSSTPSSPTGAERETGSSDIPTPALPR